MRPASRAINSATGISSEPSGEEREVSRAFHLCKR